MSVGNSHARRQPSRKTGASNFLVQNCYATVNNIPDRIQASGPRALGRVLGDMANSVLRAAIEDAETLLRYAAGRGLPVDQATSLAILDAEQAIKRADMDGAASAKFYAAYAAVAAMVAPVTAQTFRDSEGASSNGRLTAWNVLALLFTLMIVGGSVVSFLNGSILTRMRANVAELNDGAAELRVRLGVASQDADWCNHLRDMPIKAEPVTFEQLATLQRFASGMRDLRKDALRLGGNPFQTFVWLKEADPIRPIEVENGVKQPVESPPTDPRLEINPEVRNLPNEVLCKIGTFQSIRDFARNVSLNNEMIFGAISSFVLPVLYAWLGAIAFGLRSRADAIRNHTYRPFYGDLARLITAGIAGAVLGLFNGFTLGTSFSPLAVAFLVGYAVEVFFSFLDTTINAFRSKDGKEAKDPAAPVKPVVPAG